MSDWPDCPPMSNAAIKDALGPTIHYSTSCIESVPACGKKGVPTSENGDEVDCKNCRRRFVKGKNGALYYDQRWTRCCSGCCEHGEMKGCPDGRGLGCHECGYTGKRRDGFHAPINKAAEIELGIR